MFGGSASTSPTRDSSAQSDKSNARTGPGSLPAGLDLNVNTNPHLDESTSGGLADRSHSISSTSSPANRSSSDSPSNGAEKKRRSSGIAKAGALFANARHSLHLSGASSSTPSPVVSSQEQNNGNEVEPSAIQKLGKIDPALSVPQGSLNNSAGESRPGPRSTFRVGVTEDKNRKCRRTMEDTHAYLYNFLTTPAPDVTALPGTADEALSDSASSPRKTTSLESASEEHVVETDNGYFAIFDGHAGTFAADWCGKKLHVLLEDIIRKNPNSPIPELLDQTFTTVDAQLDKLPVKNSGCTAITAVLRWEDRVPNPQSATGSIAIAPAAAAAAAAAANTKSSSTTTPVAPTSNPTISSSPSHPPSPLPKLQNAASRQRVLYTANVGDARIVLCRNGKALRLSYDHKGSDENEGKRIANAGGLILNNRVNGVLAVTRALGDAYMKDLVTGHPYTTETVIQPDVDEFLILACDGLWDVCSDQEAVDLIRDKADPQEASKDLVDYALSRFSTDNLSCMIVRFDRPAVTSTLEHKTAPIGVEGDSEQLDAAKGGSASRSPQYAGLGIGISEADAIVGDARKSLDLQNQLSPGSKGENAITAISEEKSPISQEIIREEEEKEAGPEVDERSLNKVTKGA